MKHIKNFLEMLGGLFLIGIFMLELIQISYPQLKKGKDTSW